MTLHLYDVLQVRAGPTAGVTLCLQVVQKGRDVFIVHTPQMLQHCTPTGRDGAQQAHGTPGVFSNAEFASLNSVDATDERLDLLGQLLSAEGHSGGQQEDGNVRTFCNNSFSFKLF